MTPVPEPKDGNKGCKKPVMPIEYVKTEVRYTKPCVYYTITWKDASGDLYTTSRGEFFFDMKYAENN